MPVRPRRRREHVLALTLRRYMALQLGPQHDLEPLEQLRLVWVEHRARFGPDSWAPMFWERGVDLRAEDTLPADREVGCPGIPG